MTAHTQTKTRWFVAGVVTVAACLGLMLWVDEAVARYMRALGDTTLVAAFSQVTKLGNSAIWYAVALIGISVAAAAAKRKPEIHAGVVMRKRLRAWLFLIASMAASGFLVNAIKLVVGRERPNSLFDDGMATFYPMSSMTESWSFPSGHTQSIWAAMLALSCIYPPLRMPCLALAVLVSISRVIVGAHFVSDIVGGAFIAIVVACVFRHLFERRGTTLNLSSTAPNRVS